MTDKARIEEIRKRIAANYHHDKSWWGLVLSDLAFLLGEVERLTEAAELRKQVKDDAIAQMNVWAKAAEKAEQARDAALAFHDAWVECEVAMATGSPDLFREKRSRLIALHRALSPSDRIEPTPEEGKD
jgi:hypothetical protein